MLWSSIVTALIVSSLSTSIHLFVSQAPDASEHQGVEPYSLKVSTNEVVVSFHVEDAQGRSISDLRLNELGLYDNERRPRQIVAFSAMHDLPLRAGILVDKSESMERAASQAIASRFTLGLLRQPSDQAFVMDFASQSRTVQPWTNNSGLLSVGLHTFVNVSSHIPGTAIFDALYRACSNEFSRVDYRGSGNFILLFSDGEDNKSRASLSDAVTACQRTSTAIYVFRPVTGSFSSGLQTLRELAEQSGGEVFHADESVQEIDQDLRTIEVNLRSQYRLVYRPADLKHDGAFHNVALITPKRVSRVVVRSGYYAPVR